MYRSIFHINNPLFLLLLIIVPLFLLIHRRTRVEATRWRKSTTLVLRIAAVLCLILALADLHRKDKVDVLATVFLLDVSDSVPTSQQQEGIHQINAAVNQLKSTDTFSLILFAGEASIRLPMRLKTDQPRLTPEILTELEMNREATDIVVAIQLAMRILPEAWQKRIVLLSDGLQNVGTLDDNMLELLRASGIEIFTIPLTAKRENEVWIHNLRVQPSQTRLGQAFTLKAVVESTKATQITAQLYRDDGLISEAQVIELKQGIQVIEDFPPQRLDKAGSYIYQLKISSTDDTILENNTGYAFVHVQGHPHALYVEGDVVSSLPLQTVLEENGFVVSVIPPSEFPSELVDLQRNDVVILSNVSADVLSASQMTLIQNYVRDLGKGLVVIGGDHAFGKGGYHDTPLERALPVDMTPRQRKESLALMFVVDTSGSMADYVGPDRKITLAIEGIRAGVREFDDEDLVGVVGFAVKIKEFPLTTDHPSIIRKVGELSATGGTKMYNALERAHARLKAVDAKQKHIVLLSDGQERRPIGDFEALARQIAADSITVTALAIGDAAREVMEAIATEGKGKYVQVQNVNQLPKILADEVRQTQKYTIQEAFQPIISELGSQILAGIDRLPKLYGYIATSEKEHAQVHIQSHEEHPILATWNYGLGRSVAFTSDVKPRWATDWIAWEYFRKFWGQAVNWTLPSIDGNADFDLNVSQDNGTAQVIIQTETLSRSKGDSPRHSKFNLRVVHPDGQGETVEMQQVTPTQYKGEFPLNVRGVYLVTAQGERNGEVAGLRTETLVLSYPAEVGEFETNRQLLSHLASRTNGIYEPSPEQIGIHTGEAVEQRKALVAMLLIATILLFVAEMILRRLSIASGYFAELRTQLATLRRRDKTASLPTLTRLNQKKATLARTTTPSTFTSQRVAHIPRQESAVAQSQVKSSGVGRLLQAKRQASNSKG